MTHYHFSNALDYTFAQLAEMHNSSFRGYFMPADMTPVQVAEFWRIYQIDAVRCVVMHNKHNSFVGMARMGARGTRGWCGGLGIVPAFRGTGAGKLLAAEMVRVAWESELTQLQLEVLTQNIPAIKVYESVGFVARRRLFGLQIATSALSTSATAPTENLPLETLLSWLQQSSHRPYWGLEAPSILSMHVETLAAPGPDGRLNGFVVQRFDNIVRLQVVRLQSQFTANEFATLLRSVAANATTIQIFNEPEDSPLLQRYLDLGFSEFFSQHEMLLDL